MKYFGKNDAAIIAAIIILALISLWALSSLEGERGEWAAVIVDGAETARLSLGTDTVYELPQNPAVVVEVSGGAAFFKSSDCPDKVCVRSGRLKAAGRQAVCLPNKVVLKITGELAVDAVAR